MHARLLTSVTLARRKTDASRRSREKTRYFHLSNARNDFTLVITADLSRPASRRSKVLQAALRVHRLTNSSRLIVLKLLDNAAQNGISSKRCHPGNLKADLGGELSQRSQLRLLRASDIETSLFETLEVGGCSLRVVPKSGSGEKNLVSRASEGDRTSRMKLRRGIRDPPTGSRLTLQRSESPRWRARKTSPVNYRPHPPPPEFAFSNLLEGQRSQFSAASGRLLRVANEWVAVGRLGRRRKCSAIEQKLTYEPSRYRLA